MAEAYTLGLFNAHWYLARNPDVADAVRLGLFTAEEHFRQFGNAEGRAPGPLFNPQDYLAANPDVAAAVQAGLLSPYDHFTQFGASEGRTPVSFFDPDFYLSQNPDVAAAVEAGIITATEHFLLYGQSEPRQINPFIDLGSYLDVNPDLAAANAQGVISPLAHLLTYGVAEGRDLGNGINLGVFASDPTFQEAIESGNLQGALGRVQEVAPFLPGFEPPAGWQAPADTPIPTDFTPPEGTKLVIPPSVVVPPDAELPETFEPVNPPGPSPAPKPAPVPPTPKPGGDGGGGSGGDNDGGGGDSGGGGGSLPFDVKVESGVVHFANGSGDISFTTNGSIATFFRGAAQAATKVDLGDVSKIRLTADQTLTATAAQITGRSIDGAGAVKVTELESTLDADLSTVTAATVTATYVLRGDGQGMPPAFVGNIGNAKLVVSAEKADYMGVSADFREAGFRLGGDASFEILHPAGIEISAEALSGKTVTGNGTLDVLAHGAGAAGLDTRHVAESIFLGITFTADADISANTQLVNVDGYRTMSPSELNSLPTLTLSATQASGVLILNYGNIVIKGLDGDTNLDDIQSVQADASAPMPAVKGVVSATVDLSQVNLDKLTHLEISGTGHTVTLDPEQYLKWNGKITGAAGNTIAFSTAPFTVEVANGTISFGGIATGDITVTEGDDGTLIFTREGVVAASKPTIDSLADDTGIPALTGGDKLLMSAEVFSSARGKLADGAATISGNTTDPAHVAALVGAVQKITAISGEISLTAAQFVTGGLADKLADGSATVDATGVRKETTANYDTLHSRIDKIKADGGITHLHLILSDVAGVAGDAAKALLSKATAAKLESSGAANVVGLILPYLDNIADGGILNDLLITNSYVSDAAVLAKLLGKYSDGRALVNVSDMNADQLNAIAAAIGKISDYSGLAGTMIMNASELTDGSFAKLLPKHSLGTVHIDAIGETNPTEIAAILAAAKAGKIASAELKNLIIDSVAFNAITDATAKANVNSALTDQIDKALTVNGSNTGVIMDASYYTKGIKLNGGSLNDNIVGSQGDDIIRGGAGDDTVQLGSGGSDVVVFEAAAASNGKDLIIGFQDGARNNGGDVLDFSNFVALTGGVEGAGAALEGTFEFLTSGAANGGTNIAGKVFLWDAPDTTALAALIDSTASNGRLGLASGEKAVVLYKDDNINGDIVTFNIAYITGTGNNGETIQTVGQVEIDFQTNDLIAANFGIGI